MSSTTETTTGDSRAQRKRPPLAVAVVAAADDEHHELDEDDLDPESSSQAARRQVAKMRTLIESIHGQVRLVKLCQREANAKLGFSLRGGKESTGSSVGVFVSHVERRSEADKQGLKIGDQLIQVNGLSVNQATYSEVIGLIRQTPRHKEILLEVSNLGKIPVQDRSGDPIHWLPVAQVLEAQLLAVTAAASSGAAPVSSTSRSLSSDEGIESCERHQRAPSLSSEISSIDEEPANSGGQQQQRRHQQQRRQHHHISSSASSLAASSAAGSISISSLPSSSADEETGAALEELNTGALEKSRSAGTRLTTRRLSDTGDANDTDDGDENETLIRVPGTRCAGDSPFGCGVVKGPDEWPGIFVQHVKPNSLAERVGLEPGDQLTRAGGRLLFELPFDSAIALIKRLQQQQDELLLHVRKGAALKHLASRQQQQQQQQQRGDGCDSASSGLQLPDDDGGDNSEEYNQEASEDDDDDDQLVAGAGQLTSRAAPLAAERNGQRLMVDDDGDSRRRRMQSTGGTAADWQKNGRPGNPSGVRPTDGSFNPISGTQNQLSGKQQQRREQEHKGVVKQDYDDDDDDDDDNEHSNCNSGSGGNSSSRGNCRLGRSQSPPLDAAVNMEMAGQRIGSAKLEATKRLTSNQLDRGDQPSLSQSKAAAAASATTTTTTTTMAPTQMDKSSGRRQNNQPVAPPASRQKISGKLQERAYGDDDVEEEQQYDVDRTMNGADSRLGDGDNDNDDDEHASESERIRIVSQNCKLHHHPQSAHSKLLRSSFVHEKFPHPAAKLQFAREKQQQQQPQARKVGAHKQVVRTTLAGPPPPPLAPRNLQHRTVLDGASLNCGAAMGSSAASVAPVQRLHRYVSMDSLSLCLAATNHQDQHHPQQQQHQATRRQHRQMTSSLGCNSGELTRQQQQLHHHRHRLSMATMTTTTTDNQSCYSRPLGVDHCSSQGSHQQQQQTAHSHLYRRSKSVLGQYVGQGSPCCLAEMPQPKTVAAGAVAELTTHHLHRHRGAIGSRTALRCVESLLGAGEPTGSQCCLSQQPQQQPSSRSHYSMKLMRKQQYGSSSTLNYCGLPLASAAARSKARSMDKLNMNINLNYVKIAGLPTQHYRMRPPANTTRRQHQQPAFCLAAAAAAADQMVPIGCRPTSAAAIHSAAPAVHHYAATSALISSSSKAPSVASRNVCGRIRAPAANCCVASTFECSTATAAAARHQAAVQRAARCQYQQHQQSIIVSSSSSAATTVGAHDMKRDSLSCGTTTSACCARDLEPVAYLGAKQQCSRSRASASGVSGSSCSSRTWALSKRTAGCTYSCCANPPLGCCNSVATIQPVVVELLCSGSTGNSAVAAGEQQPCNNRATAKAYSVGDGGASTDSSGYLSAGPERRRQQTTRLLKMCPAAQQQQHPPPPPPPPPPSVITADGQPLTTMSGGAQARDTRRQRLTTFLSPVAGGAGSSCQKTTTRLSPGAGPYSPISYSPASTTSGSMPTDRGDETSGCALSSSSSASSMASPMSSMSPSAATGCARTGRHVPCPPPPPAPDAEFDCKISSILKQETGRSKFVSGERRQQQQQQQLQQNDICEAKRHPEATSRQDRLCFVDELKMLAKRQQQQLPAAQQQQGGQQQQQQQIDSSTLIKIINASKMTTMRKRCACQSGCQRTEAAGGNGESVAAPSSNSAMDSGKKCIAAAGSASQRSAPHECVAAAKSVKLSEEDNKRRQHEMLMKEFKSAHSKMFSKRRNAELEAEDDDGQDEASTNQNARQVAPAVGAAAADKSQLGNRQQRTVSKVIGNPKKITTLHLAARTPVQHLAAAN